MFRSARPLLLLLALAAVGAAPLLLASGPAAAQQSCLRIQRTNGPTFLSNGCNRMIAVHWIDQRHCRSGCAEHVCAGGRAGVTAWNGNARYAVCWDYESPTGFLQDPYGTHHCR